jgi:hypothetical protein
MSSKTDRPPPQAWLLVIWLATYLGIGLLRMLFSRYEYMRLQLGAYDDVLFWPTQFDDFARMFGVYGIIPALIGGLLFLLIHLFVFLRTKERANFLKLWFVLVAFLSLWLLLDFSVNEWFHLFPPPMSGIS